jgi:hypothetical protein
MRNLFQIEKQNYLNRQKYSSTLLQPSEYSIRFILDFAQAYQVRRIAGKRFLEVILN